MRISGFLDWVDTAALKESTRRHYVYRINLLIEFLDRCYGCSAWPHESSFQSVVQSFLNEAVECGSLSGTSVNNCLSTFRLLAVSMGQSIDGVRCIANTRAERASRRQVLLETQIDHVLVVASSSSCARDLALVLMFLSTQIRIGECAALKIDDLIRSEDTLKIRLVRGSREIHVPAASELSRAMDQWLIERHQSRYGHSTTYVFPGQHGRMITRAALAFAIRRIGWQAGLCLNSGVLQNSGKLRRQRTMEC